MYSKTKWGTRIVVGDAVPLQVRWNQKIMNNYKNYIYPNQWNLVNHK